jgi:hypothetical protein
LIVQKFKINRSSWHYKLNANFLNDSINISHWEKNHSDFCSYWRATIGRIVFGVFLSVFTLFILAVLLAVTIAEPAAVGLTLLGIVAVIGFIIALAALSAYMEASKNQSSEPKTLIGQRYAAYKNKYCPLVEFDE